MKLTRSHLRALRALLWLVFAVNLLVALWAREFDDLSWKHAVIAWASVIAVLVLFGIEDFFDSGERNG